MKGSSCSGLGSPERRARIGEQAKRMIDEELMLRDLRKAHQMTREKLTAVLGVKQESVSNLEKRSDMLLSTLREYVEALGGELEIRATFPGRRWVTIKAFLDVGSEA